MNNDRIFIIKTPRILYIERLCEQESQIKIRLVKFLIPELGLQYEHYKKENTKK